jgi:hypothetical protein
MAPTAKKIGKIEQVLKEMTAGETEYVPFVSKESKL